MYRPCLILTALLTMLPACSDSTGPSRPSCDAAPCLAAVVNGAGWRNAGFTPGAAMYWTLGDTASITALRLGSDSSVEAITIRLKTFNGIGSYVLGDPSTGAYGEFAVVPKDSTIVRSSRTAAANPGEITITAYAPDSLTVSGTFSFQTSGPVPIRITRGTFRIGLMLPLVRQP